MDGSINTLFNNLATDIRNVSVAIGVVAFMAGAVQYATSGPPPSSNVHGGGGMTRLLIINEDFGTSGLADHHERSKVRRTGGA